MVSPVPASVDSASVRIPPTRPPAEEPPEPISSRLAELRAEPAEAGNPLAEQLVQSRDVSIRFSPRPDLDLIQSFRFDRVSEEVLREVPTSARIKFQERFRDFLSESIGRHVDLRG